MRSTSPKRLQFILIGVSLMALFMSLVSALMVPVVQAADSPVSTQPTDLLRPLPPLAVHTTRTWSGAGGDGLWSNPANWAEGRVPGVRDRVHFPAGAGDVWLDPASDGLVAALVVEEGYAGTLHLARDLTVAGELILADGTLEQGGSPLHTITLVQRGGEIVGGSAPFIVDERATIGGVLTTPSALMSVGHLEIQAGAVVRLGENGKLNLTAEGTPLTGAGTLDVLTHRPNSVEFTGKVVTDISLAGPAEQLRALGSEPADPLLRSPQVFTETNSLALTHAEGNLTSAVIDSANGFAYFGTHSNPGQVVKVNVASDGFARVGVVTLNIGQGPLTSAVIDPANGFAYFGTGSTPGQVVKVNIAPDGFAALGSITLNPGENSLTSAVIDPANGFAYFGGHGSSGTGDLYRGRVVKVNIAPDSFARVGAITLDDSWEIYLTSAVIDPANGFAYFGAHGFFDSVYAMGKVVKVNITPDGFAHAGSIDLGMLGAGSRGLTSAVIDSANNFAYFGTGNTPGQVVKVNIAPGGFARVGAITLAPGENSLTSAVIDPANSFAYFGTHNVSTNDPGRVVKVNIAPDSFARVGATTLNAEENDLVSAVIDPANGFAYFGTGSLPGRVVKVNVAPNGFARVGAIQLRDEREASLHSAVFDPINGFAYFGTSSTPSRVVKVNVTPGNFARVGVITLAPGEKQLTSAVIDPAKGFAYFGTSDFPGSRTSPGQVVKINIAPGNFARVGAITLALGEYNLDSAVIDPTNGFAYFAASDFNDGQTSPSKIVKVNIASDGFARVGSVALNPGENYVASAVIDPANGFAYFGAHANPGPGQVVKVNVAPDGFARVGSIPLNSEEDYLDSAVIDPANGFAYFGSSHEPAFVVKVNVAPNGFARVGAIGLDGDALASAVFDPINGFAYFGGSSRVIKVNVAPGNFAHMGTITLAPENGSLASAVIDPANGFAYFGTTGSPSRVVQIDVGQTVRQSTILYLPLLVK